MRREVRTSAAVGVGVAALLLAGCSDDGGTALPPEPSPTRSSAVPSEQEPESTPRSSDEPSEEAPEVQRPLSAYERDPAVAAVRTFLAGYARALNRGDEKFRGLAGILTSRDTSVLQQRSVEDRGLRFPGPAPYTPLEVVHNGARAEVHGCMVTDGFAVDRSTGRPPRARDVAEVAFALSRLDGRWRVQGEFFSTSRVTCRGVDVPGPTWKDTTT